MRALISLWTAVSILSLSLPAMASAKATLAEALKAASAGEGEAANAALVTLSDDREARLELGLDLVEAWWRVAHSERAINTLSKYRQEAPRSPDPVVRARIKALTGDPFDVEASLTTFAEASALCGLLPVAESLDAVGQRDAGQRLLTAAWAQGGCDDADAQRAVWERPRGAAVAEVAVKAAPPRQYALGPGHEPRFIRVLPEKRGELPKGMGLMHMTIPEDHAEAHYGAIGGQAASCAEAPLCVSLWHASAAQSGDTIVGHFAVRVQGEMAAESAALVEGISARLRAETDWNPWVDTTPAPPPAPEPVPEPVAVVEAPPVEEAESDHRLWIIGGLVLLMAVVIFWRRRRQAGE